MDARRHAHRRTGRGRVQAQLKLGLDRETETHLSVSRDSEKHPEYVGQPRHAHTRTAVHVSIQMTLNAQRVNLHLRADTGPEIHTVEREI